MVHWCIYSILHALSWDNESSFVFILTMQCIQRKKFVAKFRSAIHHCHQKQKNNYKLDLRLSHKFYLIF